MTTTPPNSMLSLGCQTRRSPQYLVVLKCLVWTTLISAQIALAGTYTVNRADDIVPRNTSVTCITAASSDCSLREAVIKANANSGSTIQFAASLNGIPIVLSRVGNDANANAGDLDINASTDIVGNGSSNTIIQGAADASYTNTIGDKVFGVNQDGTHDSLTVRFSNLTVRYGDNSILIPDPLVAYTGGGVDVYQTGSGNVTTFTDCMISYCRNRNSYGGGLNFDQTGSGSLTLTRVTFDHNQTPSSYGGALNLFGSQPTISITDCSFTSNTTGTTFSGGAIFYRPTTGGSLSIDNTVFSGNTAGNGGAVYTDSSHAAVTTITIQNSRFTGNTASSYGGGLYIYESQVTLAHSRIVNNTATADAASSGLYVSNTTAIVNATNNWWGCSTGPSASPCNRAFMETGGTLTYTPWRRDRLTSADSPLVTNQSTTLTASFLTNSAGTSVPLADLTQIIGLPVTWGATGGSLSGSQTAIQAAGTATATFAVSGPGSAVIYAKVDNDNTLGTSSNVLNLTVNNASTTTVITADTPDPSVIGQAVTVSFTVTGTYGNSPTVPTGNVTVSDGTNQCIGTVAAGSCSVTLMTAGARTLTATYVGDANFLGSTSTGESHTVNLTNTTISSINRTGSNPTNQATVTWTVTFADALSGLAPSNFSLANIGLGGTPAITGVTAGSGPPSTSWSITASTGTGSGSLGLNLANDTGLTRHITTALPYVGQVFDVDKASPTVSTFIVTTPSATLNVPVTALTATDNVGVTGYMITQTSTAPGAGDTGWSGTAPTIYTVVSPGSYTLFPWAKDAVGNVSTVFASPRDVIVRSTPVITWSNPADIAYGTALSATQLNATANVPGGFVYSPVAGTVLTPGSHTLHVDFTPTDTTHYNNAAKDVTIIVTQGAFFALTPCRLFDTRTTGGLTTGPLEHGESRVVRVVETCGLPTTAGAIVANITVVNATATGELNVIAGNLTVTGTSVIQIPLNRARANNAIIQLATDGAGTIVLINNSTSGNVHVIMDVNGYFQ